MYRLAALVISIHAPLAGRDLAKQLNISPQQIFQSTRPLRGATTSPDARCRWPVDFNPRAPCGARLHLLLAREVAERFQSTRPLRGATTGMPRRIASLTFQSTRPLRGATLRRVFAPAALLAFQSTRPLRGATRAEQCVVRRFDISIHAPLAGRDGQARAHRAAEEHFNPRAPCGARRLHPAAPRGDQRISIHAPLAGRDRRRGQGFPCLHISIHAPLAGRDQASTTGRSKSGNFNPRAPCGARPYCFLRSSTLIPFQSTRPLRGATAKVYKLLCTFLR